MKKCLGTAAWLAVFLAVSGNSFASSAWWMLCDWCETDSDFQQQALSAPGTYSPVYVTNRDTNETRKYDRTFIVDDLFDGIEKTVAVTRADFPDAERAVFEQAVNDANTVYVRFPRGDLAGIFSNLGGQDSVVGDIYNGYIDNEVVNAVSRHIERRNLLPSATSVNREAGLDIVGTGGNLGAGETIRVRDLSIEIVYSDGSTISVRRRGSDGKFVNWSIKDSEGNVIPIKDPGSGTAINPASFEDREFFFGGSGAQSAALLLLGFVQQGTGLQCSAEVISANGSDIVRVFCHRP